MVVILFLARVKSVVNRLIISTGKRFLRPLALLRNKISTHAKATH